MVDYIAKSEEELHEEFIDSVNHEIHGFYKDGVGSNDLVIIHVPQRFWKFAGDNDGGNYLIICGVKVLFLKNRENTFSSVLICGIGNIFN